MIKFPAKQLPGPALPQNLEQRVRWQPCINTSNYDCPPFGVLSRVYLDGTGGEVVDGTWSLYLDRPDSIIAARQSAADLVFNGPEVLKAGKPGRCTEDFPVRGLHLRSDTLYQRPFIGASGLNLAQTVSLFCGPRADSFLLWNSGFAFRWLHRDQTFVNDTFELGVITHAAPPFVGGFFQIANAATDVAVGATLGMASPASVSDPSWEVITQGYEVYTFDVPVTGSGVTPHGIKFLVGGIYSWKFYCTLSSSTAPQQAALTIRSYLDNAALVPYCFRLQQIEIDNYGAEVMRSAENVCMTGEMFVTANQVLNFRNASAYPITCMGTFCEVRRIGP